MSSNNTKSPLATVPVNGKNQPKYSQTVKKPDGTLVAVNASEVGESPVSTNYPHN